MRLFEVSYQPFGLSVSSLVAFAASEPSGNPVSFGPASLIINHDSGSVYFPAVASLKSQLEASLIIKFDEAIASRFASLLINDNFDSLNSSEDLEFLSEGVFICFVGKPANEEGSEGVALNVWVLIGVPFLLSMHQYMASLAIQVARGKPSFFGKEEEKSNICGWKKRRD
jgi:hypothetical protein